MRLSKSVTRALGVAIAMIPAGAMADTTNVSFLTHWAPDTVAK